MEEGDEATRKLLEERSSAQGTAHGCGIVAVPSSAERRIENAGIVET